HVREFFGFCSDAIGDALGATPIRASKSDRPYMLWQDYACPDGTRIVVGLLYTDEYEKASDHLRAPILWAGAKADHLDNWAEVREALDARRPDSWRQGNVWEGRPTIWRPLRDVVAASDLDGQRASLTKTARDVWAWLEGARG